MSDLQNELDSIVNSYYEELMSIDTTETKKYKFSKEYIAKRKEVIAFFNKQSHKQIRHFGRRIAIALIAAVMIGTITVFAYKPSREFIINTFSNHSEITVSDNSNGKYTYKDRIERKYSITVPEEYTLDKEGSVETDEFIIYTYYNSDKSKSIVFEQQTQASFKTSIDNERTGLITKTDKNGQEILVYNINDEAVSIIWDNGEYIFTLSGEISEYDLMEIYYSLK